MVKQAQVKRLGKEINTDKAQGPNQADRWEIPLGKKWENLTCTKQKQRMVAPQSEYNYSTLKEGMAITQSSILESKVDSGLDCRFIHQTLLI